MPTTLLSAELAERFACVALGHVTREYPNKLDQVLSGEADLQRPRDLHPIFYGSFDWHSCVHSYWTMARLLRRFPELPSAGAIKRRFDEAFTAEAVAGELAFLQRPSSAGFERPYGWAWLLALAAELRSAPGQAQTWGRTLRPLSDAFAERWRAFLPKADYPVRGGAHTNTAFALTLTLDYARATEDGELATAIEQKAVQWYGSDRDCQAWEPSQDDFLSPALVEAAFMSRALPVERFREWSPGFLPRLESGEPAALFTPARVSDPSDGKIAHLDGLNLSRAWCWRTLALHLVGDAKGRAVDAAERHLQASLPSVEGDYMGEHWLATYAVLALDGGL